MSGPLDNSMSREKRCQWTCPSLSTADFSLWWRLETASEEAHFVELAANLDDGEAMTGAIGRNRGYAVAIDDRKARRVLGEWAHELRLISTLEIVRRWSATVPAQGGYSRIGGHAVWRPVRSRKSGSSVSLVARPDRRMGHERALTWLSHTDANSWNDINGLTICVEALKLWQIACPAGNTWLASTSGTQIAVQTVKFSTII